MPEYVYLLNCQNCGQQAPVTFGRRETDGCVVAWEHTACPNAEQARRVTEYNVSTLPIDENGNLIPPPPVPDPDEAAEQTVQPTGKQTRAIPKGKPAAKRKPVAKTPRRGE